MYYISLIYLLIIAKNCGGNQTVYIAPDKSATLHSPGYPEGYTKLLHCEWMYSTDPGNHLVVKFIDLSLEESSECAADKVITIFKSIQT